MQRISLILGILWLIFRKKEIEANNNKKSHTHISQSHWGKIWERVTGRAPGQKQTLITYGQLIFDKGGKNKKWEKDSLFSKCAGKTVQLHVNQWN